MDTEENSVEISNLTPVPSEVEEELLVSFNVTSSFTNPNILVEQ